MQTSSLSIYRWRMTPTLSLCALMMIYLTRCAASIWCKGLIRSKTDKILCGYGWTSTPKWSNHRGAQKETYQPERCRKANNANRLCKNTGARLWVYKWYMSIFQLMEIGNIDTASNAWEEKAKSLMIALGPALQVYFSRLGTNPWGV